MSKKVFIGVGHGGNDPGAVKYLVEKDVNLKMAKACRDYLKAEGLKVKMSRTKDENDPVSEEVRECNEFDPDVAVDIHNNSGGGNGFEAFYSVSGGVGKTLARNIEAEVKKIGQNSRGIKTKKNGNGSDYFCFIRSTKCPAVICEGVFVDNRDDAKQADTDAECREFGIAYAKGILKTLNMKEKKEEEKPKVERETPKKKKEYLVRVSVQALNIRKGPGTSYDIAGVIRDKGTYTITEEKEGWGKLKSGAGWIALKHTKKA